MIVVILFGGVGAVLGIVAGFLVRRLRLLAAIGAGLAICYLAIAYLSAPSTAEGAGNEATLWHGRYAEWALVLFVTATNLAVYLVVGGATALLRRRRARAM